jgi:hypothetical protein
MTQRPPIRIVLDEEAFRALVAGAVASFPTLSDRNVEIILSDIGFDRMMDGGFRKAIERAWAQSLMRIVHLGDVVKTKGGKTFAVERIEDGPERGVYIFSGPREDVLAGECHVTGWEIAERLRAAFRS